VVEVPELSRVRRRPKPLRELDGTARAARLRLEREIFRPALRPLNMRLTVDQLLRIDEERRVADSRGVPSRSALIRSLIDEGLAWRRAARPKEPPKPQRTPFVFKS
jgi:hypothetical protein